VVKPRERRELSKAGETFKPSSVKDIEILGVGRVKETTSINGFVVENIADYLVVESNTLNKYRADLSLPPHEFHITLGFTHKDIHDQVKNIETIYKKF